MRPQTLSEVAERSKSDPDWYHHLLEFLDAFYGHDSDTDTQAAMIADRPDTLDFAVADAFLGGTAEHLARRWHLRIPGWIGEARRYLDHAVYLPNERRLRGYLLCVSPVAFRTRLIFTGADPLQRARFPYHRGTLSLPTTYPRAHNRRNPDR